jgi:hypothetical protein
MSTQMDSIVMNLKEGPAAGGGPLYEDAAAFVRRYHACEKLVREQADWSLVITLFAEDSGEAVRLHVASGRVVAIRAEEPGAAASGALPRILVRADAATLSDILRLRKLPNEPYLFGELTVQGPEPDFLRLDYVVSSLGFAQGGLG